MTTVRLMGGPMMNKHMPLDDHTLMRRRFAVAYTTGPTRYNPLGADEPQSLMSTEVGYYEPSKTNPKIWTWTGPKIQADPWKSYERKLKRWKSKNRKMFDMFGPAAYNMVGPPPERPR